MQHYAVIGPNVDSPVIQPLADKLGAALGRSAILRTTPGSPLGRAFMRSHAGGKYAYWFEPSHEGITHCLSPSVGNVRDLASRNIPGFLKMSAEERREALLTMACLYGLSGDVDRGKCSFVITYQPSDIGIYQPMLVTRKLDITHYNIASKDHLARLIFDIKTFNALKNLD